MIQSMIQRFRKTQRPDLIEKIQSALHEPCTVEEISAIFHFCSEADINQDALLFSLFSHIQRFSSHWTPEQIAIALRQIDTQTASALFFSPKKEGREITFPIANNQQSELCTAYIIPLHDEGESILWGYSSASTISQSRQQDLQRIQHLTKKRFFVAFDRNFTDRSFMLAVTAALLLEKPSQWKGYAFSGEIDPIGNIREVGFIETKQALCKQHQKLLISAPLFQHIDDILFWLSDAPIPIPSLQLAKPRSSEEKALITFEKAIQRMHPRFRLDTLCALFGFQHQDFLINHETFLPNEFEYWSRYLQHDIRRHFERLLRANSHRSFVLHAASSISALALGMGVLLGSRHPTVIYQFQNDNYHPAIDLSQGNLREIKTILPKDHTHSLSIELQASGNKHIASIYLASHNPFDDSRAMQQENGEGWGLTFIHDPRHQGNLPLSAGWIPYVRELYSFFNDLKQSGVREIHLVLSMPTAIAYALGIACGHFFHAYVYNYSPAATKKYTCVLALHEHASPF